MYNRLILLTIGCLSLVIITGCSVRTYSVTKDRVDQDLSSGNRGYLIGEPYVSDEKPRRTTRQVQVLEIESHPIKSGKAPSSTTEVQVAPIVEEEPTYALPQVTEAVFVEPAKELALEKYTVRKGDTLQKISKIFYGTTKRWMDIYNANKQRLKTPDSLYPGQVIEIPLEKIKGVK